MNESTTLEQMPAGEETKNSQGRRPRVLLLLGIGVLTLGVLLLSWLLHGK